MFLCERSFYLFLCEWEVVRKLLSKACHAKFALN